MDVLTCKNCSYFLIENSLVDSKISDSLIIKFPKRDFYLKNPKFPNNLFGSIKPVKVDLKKYNLSNANFITLLQGEQITNPHNVLFVDIAINDEELLKTNREIDLNTFIVKRDMKWDDYEVRSQVKKTWNDMPVSKKVYYSFSMPIFSKDNKYARIAVLEMGKCSGDVTTYIYRFEKNTWRQILEFHNYYIRTTTTHSNCEDLHVKYLN